MCQLVLYQGNAVPITTLCLGSFGFICCDLRPLITLYEYALCNRFISLSTYPPKPLKQLAALRPSDFRLLIWDPLLSGTNPTIFYGEVAPRTICSSTCAIKTP